MYAADSLLACLIEVLAGFRADPWVADGLDAIVEDPQDRDAHPTAPAGKVPMSWLGPRMAASADLAGTFCAVTSAESVAALFPHFIILARSLGLHDFDAAALKDARPRQLTQCVATHLHAATDFDGVRFESRHGDDLALWAVFERTSPDAVSPLISNIHQGSMVPDDPELAAAFRILGLEWAAG